MHAIEWLIDTFGDTAGYPATLLKLLASTPGLRVPLAPPDLSIDGSTVVDWSQLGQQNVGLFRGSGERQLLGWRQTGPYYESFYAPCPHLDAVSRQTPARILVV